MQKSLLEYGTGYGVQLCLWFVSTPCAYILFLCLSYRPDVETVGTFVLIFCILVIWRLRRLFRNHWPHSAHRYQPLHQHSQVEEGGEGRWDRDYFQYDEENAEEEREASGPFTSVR